MTITMNYFETGKLYEISKPCMLYPTKTSLENFIYYPNRLSTFVKEGIHTCNSGKICMVLSTVKSNDKKYMYVKILIGESTAWIFDWCDQNLVLKRIL